MNKVILSLVMYALTISTALIPSLVYTTTSCPEGQTCCDITSCKESGCYTNCLNGCSEWKDARKNKNICGVDCPAYCSVQQLKVMNTEIQNCKNQGLCPAADYYNCTVKCMDATWCKAGAKHLQDSDEESDDSDDYNDGEDIDAIDDTDGLQ